MKIILSMILVLSIFLYGCSTGTSENNTGTSILDTVSTLSTLKELTDMISKGPTGQHTIKYDMDFGPGNPKTEITTYWKNESKYRMDTLSEGVESRSYMIGTQATICTKEAGKFTCFTAKPEEVKDPTENFAVTEYENNITSEGNESARFKVYRDGTMTVVGNTAKCYAFEYDISKEKLCFSNEGVLLYHKFTDVNETNEFIAKSYSTTVSDSDFDLPAGAEIIDLNAELTQIRQEYGNDTVNLNVIGECYAECDSKDLSDAALETCYNACLT
jgi:hypothetical protein